MRKKADPITKIMTPCSGICPEDSKYKISIDESTITEEEETWFRFNPNGPDVAKKDQIKYPKPFTNG